MNTEEILFWVIVGVLGAVLLLLFTNQIITNMIHATVSVNP